MSIGKVSHRKGFRRTLAQTLASATGFGQKQDGVLGLKSVKMRQNYRDLAVQRSRWASNTGLADASLSGSEVDCLRAIAVMCTALGINAADHTLRIRQQLEACGCNWSLWQRQLLAGDIALPGVGKAALQRFDASLAMAEWFALNQLSHGPCVVSSVACGNYLQQHFRGRQRELFACLFLNTRQQLLACRDLFEGTLDSAAVYPREVVAAALEVGAAGVIAVHNHPSGTLAPSQADLRITQRLRDALALLDIRLLDHVIVAGGQSYSMAAHGDGGFF